MDKEVPVTFQAQGGGAKPGQAATPSPQPSVPAAQPAAGMPEAAPASGATEDLDIRIERVLNKVLGATLPKVVGESFETYARRQQSANDKLEARIRNRQQELEAAFQQVVGDTPLSEAQKQLARNTAIKEVSAAPETALTQPSTLAPAQAQPAETDPDLLEVQAVQRRLHKKFGGVFISPEDPEAGEVTQTGDKDAFLDSYEAALAKKSARVKVLSQPAAARTSSGGGGGTPGNPIANITDPTELIRMGLSRGR